MRKKIYDISVYGKASQKKINHQKVTLEKRKKSIMDNGYINLAKIATKVCSLKKLFLMVLLFCQTKLAMNKTMGCNPILHTEFNCLPII